MYLNHHRDDVLNRLSSIPSLGTSLYFIPIFSILTYVLLYILDVIYEIRDGEGEGRRLQRKRAQTSGVVWAIGTCFLKFSSYIMILSNILLHIL